MTQNESNREIPEGPELKTTSLKRIGPEEAKKQTRNRRTSEAQERRSKREGKAPKQEIN